MYILYIICADDTIFIFRMSTDDRSLQRSSGISINESVQDDGNIKDFNNVYTVADISISTKNTIFDSLLYIKNHCSPFTDTGLIEMSQS